MDGLRKDAARNRARIVEAAGDLAARGEPLAFNTVARIAGVGVGTVYRHFTAIEELEEALVWERFDDLDRILRDTGPAELERVLTAHFTLLTEDALFEKVTERPEPALEQTVTKRTALIGRLSELMGRAREHGDLRADIDAQGVLLLVCGLAHAARSAGVAADSPEARILLRVAFDGLRVP
ncbi:TetR/AcrR family transcriptional regulator [Patulibacter americanus]|uniref:TetR/AcrR family transcriptional regulator n=1 Tax=Patulibacter americanus TaxID=588672 RepID=UPI0003B3FAF7|nr:TetR family transcriptional regulator [Patulibacter americanus]